VIIISTLAILTIAALGAYYFYFGKKLAENIATEITTEKILEIKTSATTNAEEVDTSDWKVYRNEKFGFEVKYPQEWFHQVTGGSKLTPAGIMFSDESLEFYSPAPGIYPEKFINVVLYRTPETIDEYVSNDLVARRADIEFQKEIQISGQRGILTKSILSNTIIYLAAHTKKGEFIYIFESRIPNKDVYFEVEEVFKKILSSFKFIGS